MLGVKAWFAGLAEKARNKAGIAAQVESPEAISNVKTK
jgi:hypothetical protein